MEDNLLRLLIEYQFTFGESYPEYEYAVDEDIISECLKRNRTVQELYPINLKGRLY